jgi:hypothetical protein
MSRARRHPRDPGLIQVEDKLVSRDVTESFFACDIARCKGACCVEGELGAPLEAEELNILEEIYPDVKPFLLEAGIGAIEAQGTWVQDFTEGFSTPLVEGRECAYATFTPEGIALCGIEQAYNAGATSFRKPVSCHLYPIRVHQSQLFETLYYDRWSICSPACRHGEHTGTRVYEFVKEALIRKYGEAFYQSLDEVAQYLDSTQ